MKSLKGVNREGGKDERSGGAVDMSVQTNGVHKARRAKVDRD